MAGIIDALRAFFDPPIAPYRGDPIGRVVNLGRDLEVRSMWSDLDGSTTGKGNTLAGVTVSRDTAMNAPAVWACVRLISGAISGLPLDLYQRGADGNRTPVDLPGWAALPMPGNPNITRGVFVQTLITSLLLDGNAFLYCLPNAMRPQAIRVLNPSDVEIKTTGDDVTYKVAGAERELSPIDVVHIPYLTVPGKARGLNPIDAARESIGLALAADQYGAAYFGNGATLSGVLEGPEGWDPAPEALQQLKKDFQKKHVGASKSHAVGVLTGGVKFQEMTGSNRDSQFLELREFQVEDIGRLYGVPPHMIGSQKPGAVAYASVEQRNIDFVTHGLQPVIERVEDGFNRMTSTGTYFKFSVSGLLRGDVKSRMEAYQTALNAKIMDIDEVRRLEELPPTGLGYLQTPNNNAPDPRYEAVGALIRAGFEPGAALAAVGLPPIPHLGLAPVTVQSARDAAAPTDEDRGSGVHVHLPEVTLPAITLPDTVSIPAPVVNVEPAPVNVDMTPFTDAVRELSATVRTPVKKRVIRDKGRIVGLEEWTE